MFCNICEKFIKNVSANEQVKGTEVCIDCKQTIDAIFKDMHELRAKAQKEIAEIVSDIEKELSKIEKIHTKVEKRLDNIFTSTKLDLEEMKRIVVEGEKKEEEKKITSISQ